MKIFNIKCTTPRCAERVTKYGYKHPKVFQSGDEVLCEHCGGVFVDDKWVHKCKACGIEVEPGELVGLFVPHSCIDCAKKRAEDEIARGAVCRMCNRPYSGCCC